MPKKYSTICAGTLGFAFLLVGRHAYALDSWSIDYDDTNGGYGAQGLGIVLTPSTPTKSWSCGYKLDSSGVEHWSTVYDNLNAFPSEILATSPGEARGIATDENSEIYVAGFLTSSGTDRWHVRHYDGTSWADVDPDPYGTNSVAYAVTIDSNGDAWVVGVAKVSGVLHLKVRSNRSGSFANELDWVLTGGSDAYGFDIQALYPSDGERFGTDIYVSGTTEDSSGHHHAVIRHWNGSTWSTLDDWDPTGAGSVQNDIARTNGVALDGNGKLWGAGRYDIPSGTSTGSYWFVRNNVGGSMTVVDSFASAFAPYSALSVRLFDYNFDMFVVGAGFVSSCLAACALTSWEVRHWNGTSWLTSDSYQYATGKSAAAHGFANFSNSVFVTGYATDSSGVDHWVVRKHDF